MNIRHLLIAFLIPIIGSAQAETVYIENYFLAKKLEEIVPGCIENRELDTECTDLSAITALDINDESLLDIQEDLFEEHVGNLYGLEYLTGLKNLTLTIGKLDLAVSDYELPDQLENLTILIGDVENLNLNDEMVEVEINGLPSSIKKLSVTGGREGLSNFGVNARNLPVGLEEIDAESYYLDLGTLPVSVKKVSLSYVSDLDRYRLNEGLAELTIRNHTYFFEESDPRPLLPTLPSSLKKLTVDGLTLYINGELTGEAENDFYMDKFILNEGLESFTIQYAQWFKMIKYPSTIKFIEYNNTNGSLLGELPEGLETLKYNDNYYYLGTFKFPNSLRNLELRQIGMNRLPDFNPGLLSLDISLNPVSSLFFLPSTLEILTARNCTIYDVNSIALPGYLKELHLDDNMDLACLPALPRTLKTLTIDGTEVTCIPNETDYIYNSTELPLCTSTCGASIGNDIFTGRVFLSLKGGWQFEEGDIPIAGAIIQTNKGNIITDNEGRYSVTVEPFEIVEYKIEYYHPLLDKTYHPGNVIIEDRFEHMGTGEIHEDVDFAVYLIKANDLEVAGSNNKAKPGFDNTARFTVTNFGASPENIIRLAVQKPLDWAYQSSNPTATTITSDSIIWENISLAPLQSKTFAITSKLPATSSILGDLYTYTAKVTPAENDVHPANNRFVLSDTIRGAYDPNDKLVYPSQILPEYSSGERFIYTVRFQNTGTDTATFVYILDTIQTGLIANSIDIIDSSHAMTWTALENGVIRFDFQNIQLPDSTTSPIGSQGFVTFSLVPETGLPQGTIFENKAAIYFDFNAPIITNTATVKVALPTSIRPRNNFASKIYPNPAKNRTRIEWSETGKAYVSVIDISGRIIHQSSTMNQYQDIALERLSSGMYFIKVDIGTNSSINKLIVE